MKKFTQFVLVTVITCSSAFAIGGFGLQLGQSSFSVARSDQDAGLVGTSLTTSSFENAYGFGGYLYIDAIPFIDFEIDGNISGNTYDINFVNQMGAMEPLKFAWASSNVYYTLRKKVFGLSIPFLAGAKLHAGGGFNTHTSTPMASLDMVEELLGGDLIDGDPANLNDNLKTYLEDNAIDATGIHIQAGLQFKLLMLDTFLNYRYTIVDDVVPKASENDVFVYASGFGSINLRVGFGI